MRRLLSAAAGGFMLCASAPSLALTLQPIGVFRHGGFATSAAEIAAFDPASRRLFVVNGETRAIDVLDLSDPTAPRLVRAFSLADRGGAPNSVAVRAGVVAAALDGRRKTDPGHVVFFRAADLAVLGAVEVGPMPDMVGFSPDGRYVVAADEGEPDDAVTIDPEGSVAVIDVSAGFDRASVRLADFKGFTFGPGMKPGRPGASFAQAAEPEYVAVSSDSRIAWVTLQETNAIATVDLAAAKVTAVRGLGFKSFEACPIDASDRDDRVAIEPRKNVVGMYQPDAIARFDVAGRTFLVTADEGDSQAWKGYSEEKRAGELKLDEAAFPAEVRGARALGRLKVTTTLGDEDGDGDVDRLYAFGARSISVWSTEAELVSDSCDVLERELARAAAPSGFNADNDDIGGDSRSDDKGPEPEGVATAVIDGRVWAFVGLERPGGVAVFDLSDPKSPRFETWANTRDYAMPPSAPASGDSGPEGVLFIPAAESPNGENLLVVSNEVSGATRIWRVAP